jgi:hypothetical protein
VDDYIKGILRYGYGTRLRIKLADCIPGGTALRIYFFSQEGNFGK